MAYNGDAPERCLKYYPQVIREAHYNVGLDAPAYDFMAQIETESRCNEGITAFDGGMGLGQFMPATADWMQDREKSLREIGDEPMPYDPHWAIRALILYDKILFQSVRCHEWHYAYRAYNGGAGAMNREIAKADSCDHVRVAKFCQRKIIKLKSGLLDLCVVNSSYPLKIAESGKKYKRLQ